jgi:hypothetical protein
MPLDGPPAYAWDWLTRQRLTWREVRRRLVSEGYDGTGPAPAASTPSRGRPVGDVPDWSLRPPGGTERSTPRTAPRPAPTDVPRDYRPLDTRAEVIAALRVDYPRDARLRGLVDEVVSGVAFLGRPDVPLSERGVRSAPRGMRWWWSHLSGQPLDAESGGTQAADGPSASTAGTEHRSHVPLQLRLVDVLAGYGDAPDA